MKNVNYSFPCYTFALAVLAGLCVGCREESTIQLPTLFSDGMVLQREQPITIWGWGDAGKTVQVSMANQEEETTVDKDGRWSLTLQPVAAGGPYELKVNNQIVNDVLVGDVYLCSGQSNMELTIDWVRETFAQEVSSDSNMNIRHLNVAQIYNFHGPQDNFTSAEWTPSVPSRVGGCSALGYFFAKEMQRLCDVPIGIVNASLGGSPIESWIAEDSLAVHYQTYAHEVDILKNDDYVKAIESSDQNLYGYWSAVANANDEGILSTPQWYGASCDDSDWSTYDLRDMSWQQNGLKQAQSGVYWLRNHFNADGLDVNASAKLRLGTIEGSDSVFLNDQFIGTVGYFYPSRNYDIPAGLMKEKDNVLTMRLQLRSGKAQFTEGKPHYIEQNNRQISLERNWKVRRGVAMPSQPGESFFRWRPCGLYNAMIAPLKGLKFKGVLWYQGESNTGRAYEYADLLRLMIREWRSDFNQPNLPFFLTLLANYGAPDATPRNSGWAEVREAMIQVSKSDSRVGLANAIDIGEWNDIHPHDKKTLAHRMSLEAQRLMGQELGLAIGGDTPQMVAACRGPQVDKAEMKGNKVVIHFVDDGSGLHSDSALRGFAVAGSDGRFVWAHAKTEGNMVIVSADEVKQPCQVRYAWSDNPQPCTLQNELGVAALPFNISVK